MTQQQPANKKAKMLTRVAFDDEENTTVTNQKVGDPNDHCAEDLNVLHDALTGGGAVMVEDMEIAPQQTGQMTTQAGQQAMAAKQPNQVKATQKAQPKVQAKTG